jgi:serine/arginine repetitive matrix protein 2
MRDVTPSSLSRRFTFLRAASGEPVSLDDLKSRLAEQRARGAENHLSEEEADMFLQTLSRLRSKASTSSTSGDSTHDLARESLRSDETTSSSVTSSPASTKRYSNNMFGSGKFRDYTYMRSVTKERTGKVGAGRRSTNSALLSASGHSYKMSDPPIPEDSSETDPDLSHDSDTTPLASGVDSSPSELEQGIVKTFQPTHVRRVSMAMEEVIREIEEEADGDGDGDDKILIPRAAAPERASSFKRSSVSSCLDGALRFISSIFL